MNLSDQKKKTALNSRGTGSDLVFIYPYMSDTHQHTCPSIGRCASVSMRNGTEQVHDVHYQHYHPLNSSPATQMRYTLL